MIGLVTYSSLPALSDDDRPLLAELAALGHRAAPVVWNDPGVDWACFSALVLRSCWDYHVRAVEFGAWLDRIESAGIPVWNPPRVVRWNMHKGYLRNLESRGVLVTPTEFLERGNARPLASLLSLRGWRDAVVKPAVSASATDTWRTSGDTAADERHFRALADRADVLVQPLIAEVAAEGEWSLMYIGGRYSHAMLKRPGPGDFRVQAELGGTATRAEPSRHALAAANDIVALIPGDWLYARVDGVVTQRGFMLMELECIEPLLFLGAAPGSCARLTRGLLDRLHH